MSTRAKRPVEVRCVACETTNPVSSKYCGQCGHQLTTCPVALPEPLGVTSARRPSRCERKQATVLFTDVSGFTAMSERLDSEDVFAIVDEASQVILDEVHRAGGTVNQFLGDGVMALFEESGDENHAQRALGAALAIQESLEPLRARMRRTHGVEFQVRITLHSGDVALGTIGDSLRTDYAAGQTINCAAELLRVAGPGQIVMTGHTRRLVDHSFLVEELGHFSVEGLDGHTRLYAVHGRSPRWSLALLCA